MAVAVHNDQAESLIVGMMLGSAVGDAVGLYTEGLSADEARTYYPDGEFHLDSTGQNLTDYNPDDHRSSFDDASWTDDTDMALCMLLTFLHTGGIDHVVVATRFRDRPLQTLASDSSLAETNTYLVPNLK
ncbi:hypothetical protein VSDG_07834 [Cytospora chrysosperma]|uniref:ADP-ribosylglycohydrolase n=1 Tax=Cytospora chrysosperma TaxID=252740 RepID=A0A423VJE7_CYTCH|nr:hypothetical protein VSDG_07834 [Valsa sordida]